MCQREPRARPTDQPADSAVALDPAPLTARQLQTLCRAAARHVLRGLPCSAHELSRWRRRAGAAASSQLRELALAAIDDKRPQAEGAALFATISRRHSSRLLSLLVAYQLIWDYLDSVHETQPDIANGVCLHQAIHDVYEPHGPLRHYYQQHHQHDDGRYLLTLTIHCRESATQLASFDRIQPALRQQATGSARALSINHEPDATRRQAALRSWAKRHGGPGKPVAWFELTAAAAAALGMFALLAEATRPAFTKRDLDSIADAYLPWACGAATMLDSYADREQDAENHQHIYVDYYASSSDAVTRTGRLIRESLTRAKTLRRGDTHRVILTSMVAMYLTRDSSRDPARRQATAELTRAGGRLTRLLIPILRTWRAIYRLRST